MMAKATTSLTALPLNARLVVRTAKANAKKGAGQWAPFTFRRFMVVAALSFKVGGDDP
jgi:hypothetical protein